MLKVLIHFVYLFPIPSIVLCGCLVRGVVYLIASIFLCGRVVHSVPYISLTPITLHCRHAGLTSVDVLSGSLRVSTHVFCCPQPSSLSGVQSIYTEMSHNQSLVHLILRSHINYNQIIQVYSYAIHMFNYPSLLKQTNERTNKQTTKTKTN